MLPLKEATSQKHALAERMPFNGRMFRGLLSKNEYLLYLHQQLQIFQAIEQVGVPYEGLKRTDAVQADIEELRSQGCTSSVILPATQAYADYLNSLSAEAILPHVYLNYLAIVFGGQMIKKAVPSTGRMYNFEDMSACVASIRQVQKDEWADEVNKGYDFNIAIFEDLEKECANA